MTTPVDTARAAVSDALADLHAARTCCQRAEAHLLRARAAWIDAEVEHTAARLRAEEASSVYSISSVRNSYQS